MMTAFTSSLSINLATENWSHLGVCLTLPRSMVFSYCDVFLPVKPVCSAIAHNHVEHFQRIAGAPGLFRCRPQIEGRPFRTFVAQTNRRQCDGTIRASLEDGATDCSLLVSCLLFPLLDSFLKDKYLSFQVQQYALLFGVTHITKGFNL